MIHTSCGLDCYDACKIVLEEDTFPKITGDATHPAGNGALCTLLNKSIHEASRIKSPRIDGKEVNMDTAMQAVAEAFKKESALLWRGSGNMGVMQEITNLFMGNIGGSLTKGSLCDGAGNAGIIKGRSVNRTLPLEQIAKADTVVVWGRNVTVTNAHIMPYLEGKKIVVIDPVKTVIAKKADLHLQIQPRTDHDLAMMLTKLISMDDPREELHDKSILEYCGIDIDEVDRVLKYLRNQKVVFLVGTGVQKYATGASVMHKIDSLAATLELFGKEGCGVSYLGNSQMGFVNPFDVACNRVSKVITGFSAFDTVLIQGGNPAESMPDTARVREELEAVENLIYFGLYENETSKRAKIVIPAKNFFEKEDVRLSYGHQYVGKMNKVIDSEIGISEYDFTKRLFDAFDLAGLQSEQDYIDRWLEQCKKQGEHYISPAYEALPYKDGFGANGDQAFKFIEEHDEFIKSGYLNTKQERDESYWLLSPKSSKALNTQFKRINEVQLHSEQGYEEGVMVRVRSEYGAYDFRVKHNDGLRLDSVVITSNTVGLNILTPSIVSDEGENACYQEMKVTIESV